MIKKIKSKKFYNKPFQIKKNKLLRFLLKYSECKIGDNILCFEDRDLSFDYRFAKKSQPEKRTSFTVGNVYKILDKQKNKIKILGDTDKMVWTTTNRFLNKMALRQIKLDNLNKISKEIRLHIE